MGFTLKVDGPEPIEIGSDRIITAGFSVDVPGDSNARSTDVGADMVVKGKILTTVEGSEEDVSVKLAKWSLVSSTEADCYRCLKVDVVSAGKMVRKYELPSAFVVSYNEHFGSDEGEGNFTMVVRQKKDKIDKVKVSGGYGV